MVFTYRAEPPEQAIFRSRCGPLQDIRDYSSTLRAEEMPSRRWGMIIPVVGQATILIQLFLQGR
jgi:hypothetical protein